MAKCKLQYTSTLQVVNVPGSFEIPLVAKQLASSYAFDAIIGIGAIVSAGNDIYREATFAGRQCSCLRVVSAGESHKTGTT